MLNCPRVKSRAAVEVKVAAHGAQVRVGTALLEGRVHWVVPSVLLPEGVHAGSLGPLYYPREEIEKSVAAWNYKPVVIDHPRLNGENVSACRPEVLNSRKIGVLLGTRFEDNKLKADVWVERQRALQIEPRVVDAVRGGRMMELSTGLYLDIEEARGVWNGEQYDGIARNYRPDHLALLPDGVGAASIADGAGFLRNQAAWNAALTRAKARFGDGAEPFDMTENGLVVVDRGGCLWLLDWEGRSEPKPVRPGDRYIALGAAGGSAPAARNQPAGGDRMTHEELVAELLKAWNWSEEAKAFLSSAPDAVLAELVAAFAGSSESGEGDQGESQSSPEEGGENGAQSNQNKRSERGPGAPTGNAAPPPRSAATLEEYIAAAPEAVRAVLNSAMDSYRAERKTLIDAIRNAPGNAFDAQELDGFPIAQLRKLAAIAANAKKAAPAPAPRRAAPSAAGDGGEPPVDNEPLPLPRIRARQQPK